MIYELLKKEFENNPVYDSKYSVTKIKTYNEKINTDFHDIPMPQKGSRCFCWFVILIDYVIIFLKWIKNNDPQVFLDECKHSLKKK